jgi:protein disulfide isomerase
MNQIVLFKTFDEKKNIFNGLIDENSLVDFISHNALRLVNDLNERSIETIFGRSKSAIFLIKSKSDKSLDDIFNNVAGNYRGKLIFVVTGNKEELESRLMEYFGLTDSDLPHIRICEVLKGEENVKFYVNTDAVNQENIINFINNFFEGKLSPFYKSEEIPAEQNEKVFYLVGKQFNEKVINSQVNVLVEFYAPWCQHCQKLTPIYEKVAEFFKDDPNILIAKIDATANEVPDLDVNDYPTIKFFPVNDKANPIDYVGEREFDDIVRFINQTLYPEKYPPTNSNHLEPDGFDTDHENIEYDAVSTKTDL